MSKEKEKEEGHKGGDATLVPAPGSPQAQAAEAALKASGGEPEKKEQPKESKAKGGKEPEKKAAAPAAPHPPAKRWRVKKAKKLSHRGQVISFKEGDVITDHHFGGEHVIKGFQDGGVEMEPLL